VLQLLLAYLSRRSVHRNTTPRQNVNVRREHKKPWHRLLRDDDREPGVVVEPLYNVKDALHHNRRKTQTRFIEEQQIGFSQQSHRDNEHLELPTGQKASPASAHFAEKRKITEYQI